MLNFKVIFVGSVLSRHMMSNVKSVSWSQIWWECGLEGPFGALQLVTQYKDVHGTIVEGGEYSGGWELLGASLRA